MKEFAASKIKNYCRKFFNLRKDCYRKGVQQMSTLFNPTISIHKCSPCADQLPPLLQFWRGLVSTGTTFIRGVTTWHYACSSELCWSTPRLPLRPEPEPEPEPDINSQGDAKT